MGSALPKAKTRPVSWNALEKIEPFTQEVKAQLEILKSRRRAKIFPNDALSGEMLDKIIMSILKHPLIFGGRILLRDAVVLLTRGSYVEQDDRRTKARVRAISGCQEFSQQCSF